MQAQMMPTSALPPPPSNSSQPPTPYQPSSDPSTSPSISTNPPPQPPPNIPTYASINTSPYQIHQGPSSYSQQPQHILNSQYMYQQQQQQHQQAYYPPQPPRHSIPYNSTSQPQYNRYQDQSYSHLQQQHLQQQQQYQPIYHQHPYANYPGIPINGGGGPGPATIQNGYGGLGYQNEQYQHIPYGVYPQHPQHHSIPIPTETYQQYPPNPNNQSNGNSEEDLQQQQITHSHQPSTFPQHDQISNGHPTHTQIPSQQYHPNYPPNHPYAYGVGVGYPGYQQHHPQQQQPMNYGYGSGYENGYLPPSSSISSGSRSFSKSLNPAAAGFSFTPSSTSGSRANSLPSSTPVPNGDTPSTFDQNSQNSQIPSASTIPSSSPEESTVPSIPNGHSEDTSKGSNGSENNIEIVSDSKTGETSVTNDNEEKSGLNTKPQTPVSSSAPSTDPNMSTSTTATTASTAATTVSTPVSAQTPKAPETDLPTATSPESATTQPGWTFVGEGLAGLKSPIAGTASRIASGPSTTSTNSSSNGKKRTLSTASKSSDLIKLAQSRPDHSTEKFNTYSANLKELIPSSTKVEQVDTETEKKLFQSKKGKAEASKKKAIFVFGDEKKKAIRPRASEGAKKLVFGAIDPSELDTPAPSVKVETTENASPTSEVKSSTPSSEIVTPQVKAKPFSWASLVRGPSASSSSTPSKVPSPAKSTTSLPNNENEAGPSRLPSSTETSTPQSNEQITSPPPAEKKKVPFNYAAAAAVGATMTPQEELAKLLSEGVKGKGKETQATLPRGLINTGNMCFANTILQVLVYCSPFTELFEELGKRLKADLARKTPLLEAMIIFLREFNAPFPSPSAPVPNGSTASGTSTPKGKGKDPRREAFIPENVYDAMKENKRFDSMRRGHQEDAEEYLGFFLNTLHEELLYVLSRTQTPQRSVSKTTPNGETNDHREISRPVSPGAGDSSGWLEVGKKQKTHVVRSTENKESAISRLFGGTIRSLLKTPGSKDSVTLEPYQPLQLDIQSSSVLSVEDALKHLTEPEIVPGVWSQVKKQQVDATKQIFIETFPQCWILHLKRFVYDPKEYNVVKKNKGIAYGQELVVPPEIISPGRRGAGAIKYRLFGVVYHHGATASGGHYTVAVSRQDGNGWIHFDDENVTNLPKEDVIVSKEESESGKIGLIGGREKTAYLLFYQRVR